MIIELRIDPTRCRRWIAELARSLRVSGILVRITLAERPRPPPAGLDLLLTLERHLLRRLRPCGSDPVELRELQGDGETSERAHLVFDLSGDSPPPLVAGQRILRPLYDGDPDEDAAFSALLSGRMPLIALEDVATGEWLECGRPSGESATGLGDEFQAVTARVSTLFRAFVSGAPRPTSPQLPPQPRGGSRLPLAKYAAKRLARDLTTALYRLCCYSPQWRVGWRFVRDADVWTRGDLSGPRWSVLPDPGNCFYADPFPVSWRGRHYIFLEELDHRIGRGIISVVEVDEHGPKGFAVPVLQEPWHLSYPFLFEHAGEMWMIPESRQNREVAVYRAVEFPRRWERQATLLEGIDANDATVVRHEGRFWMFATTRDGAGAHSDTLSLFHADDLFGPWIPHRGNPILVDSATARPAGAMIHRDGRLWRPAQDCSEGYGSAVSLVEVLRLDPDGYAQAVRATIRPGRLWPGRKLHTLNRSGPLEVIDGAIIRPRMRALARLVEPLQNPADRPEVDALDIPLGSAAPRERQKNVLLVAPYTPKRQGRPPDVGQLPRAEG